MPTYSHSVTQVFPSQQTPYIPWSSGGANNQPLIVISGKMYLFLVDGQLGETYQIFIYKSIDDGVTWTDVTPSSPHKFENGAVPGSGGSGLQYVLISGVVYCVQVDSTAIPGGGSQVLTIFRFDTSTELWLSDVTPSNAAWPAGDFWSINVLAVARGAEVVIVTSAFVDTGSTSTSYPVDMAIYDTGSAAWTMQPATISGLTMYMAASMGIDSVGHIHVFGGTLPLSFNPSTDTYTADHFVIEPGNTVTGLDTLATVTPLVIASDNGDGTWATIGQPVFYSDLTTHYIAIPIRVDGSDLKVFRGVEADAPTWTTAATITASAGQVFEPFLSSQGNWMFAAALLPVPIGGGATDLHVFWGAEDSGIWGGSGTSTVNWGYLPSGGGAITGLTALQTFTGAQIIPSGPWPVYLSSGHFGALVADVDWAIFQSTFFGSLKEYWLGFTFAATGSANRYRGWIT